MFESVMTLRVYGNILYATGAWKADGTGDPDTADELTPGHIEQWMDACRERGVNTVLWQSNCGGTSTHPSPVLPLAGPPLAPHNEAWEPVWAFLGQQVRLWLEADLDGFRAYNVAAEDVCIDVPTADLLAECYPSTPLNAELGEFQSPFLSAAIQRDLGWRTQIGWRDIRAEGEGVES